MSTRDNYNETARASTGSSAGTTRNRVEAESHKDPDQLEREIEAKRRNIGNTVDALEQRLSPGQLFDQVLGYVSGNGGQFISNLGATVRANPVPTVLTSVGLLWMMSSQRHPHYYDNAYRYQSSGADGEGHEGSHLRERAGQAREKVGQARDRIADAMHSANDRMHSAGDRLHGAGERIGDGAHRAADSMRHGAASVRSGFDDLMHEQPLAAGAIGIGIGALLAACLPTTRREDELMGAASDRATEQAKQKAREVADAGLSKAEQGLSKAEQRLQRSSAGGSTRSSGAAGSASARSQTGTPAAGR